MQATSSYSGSATAGTAPWYGGGSSSSSNNSSLHHHHNHNNNGSTARAVACKNNEALQYFLYGEFDTSIALLKEAYGIFASFRHHYYLNLLQLQQQMQHHQIPSIYDVLNGGNLLSVTSATVATMTMEAEGECNNSRTVGTIECTVTVM